MSDVTRILNAIEQGDAKAADELLPLVYDELRQLAAQKLSQETPGQTLQATALVHEAYIRLVGAENPNWDNRGHFFMAAAEAMRRILIENARHKQRHKHGGQYLRVDLSDAYLAIEGPSDDLIALDEALEKSSFEERAAYLDTACGKDTTLRNRIEALLKSHGEAGDFLKVPGSYCLTMGIKPSPSGDTLRILTI